MSDHLNPATLPVASNILHFPILSRGTNENPNASAVPTLTPTFDKIILTAKKLNTLSRYRTDFNYKIYQDFEIRYAHKPIRGGIVCKTDFKLANYHPSCFKCHYTFELDTYGRGCIHECSYCYAKDELSLHGYWNNPVPLPIDINEMRRIFYTVFETSKPHKFRSVLESKVPLRIGSMSDSFMWSDLKYGVTLEALKILRFYRYPHVIFTRSDLVAHDKYLNVMDPKLTTVQFSICGTNEKLTSLIEPGAPSVRRRLSALKKLSENGYWTAVRINPLFPTFPDGYLSNRTETETRFSGNIPKFDFFDITKVDSFLDSVAESGVKTLLAGFVRLKSSSLNTLRKSSGIDLKPFFRSEVMNTGLKGNREKKYSDAEIKEYYNLIHNAATAKGLRFSTCYIRNGTKDYYQYQNLWSNKSDCCDIRGNVASFQTSAQNIPWDVRAKHTPNKNLVVESQRLESEADLNVVTPGLVTFLRPEAERAKSETQNT